MVLEQTQLVSPVVWTVAALQSCLNMEGNDIVFRAFSASPLRDWVRQLCLLPQLDTLGNKPETSHSEA